MNVLKDKFTRLYYRLWRLPRQLLRIYFHFDRWHICSLAERKYAKDIIKFCNLRTRRNSIIEIGCGLGDIIRNVDYSKRVGCDMDDNVLRASAFLSKIGRNGKVEFTKFEFPDSRLEGRFDVLVMVNWIHLIPPEVLKSGIEGFIERNINDKGCIILDTVQDKEYEHNHQVGFLVGGIKCDLKKLGEYERKREIWIIGKC